ncbi:hypothetical protein EVAR_62544_1 [Eumeta japonica]|uniref:Uncharacterized protein n=1 Tax=Eumeta variegata TaxID=151549 RepID=A0A4C1YXH0_EUMVA|nr:hypothetical protein EVAR_62544_1 [Eumeta japonica]
MDDIKLLKTDDIIMIMALTYHRRLVATLARPGGTRRGSGITRIRDFDLSHAEHAGAALGGRRSTFRSLDSVALFQQFTTIDTELS